MNFRNMCKLHLNLHPPSALSGCDHSWQAGIGTKLLPPLQGQNGREGKKICIEYDLNWPFWENGDRGAGPGFYFLKTSNNLSKMGFPSFVTDSSSPASSHSPRHSEHLSTRMPR
jgi:hypothetical protein